MLTVAIGDIHGCDQSLIRLLRATSSWTASSFPKAPVKLVFLGDYIDRGPQSAAVVMRVRELQLAGAVCLRGNHEQLAIDSVRSEYARALFLQNGGDAALHSFKSEAAFEDARKWMTALPTFYEDKLRYFVHAGIDPAVSLADQTDGDRLWIRGPFLRHTGPFERYVVHGHTPTVTLTPRRDTPDIRSNRANIDTGAVFGGKLSAAVFDSYNVAPIHTISV